MHFLVSVAPGLAADRGDPGFGAETASRGASMVRELRAR